MKTSGWEFSCQTLTQSSQTMAVSELLQTALASSERYIAEGALQCMIKLHTPSMLLHLISQWDKISERWKHMLAAKEELFDKALIQALEQKNSKIVALAIDTAVDVNSFELIPYLTSLIEKGTPEQVKAASEGILRLTEKFHELILQPRDYTQRRDPHQLQSFVVSKLEIATACFREHKREEVIEAFLMLVARENATLKHVLHDSTDPSHRPICQQLLRSTRNGVIRLFLSFLDDPRFPILGLRLLVQRRDIAFIRQLCRKIAHAENEHIVYNLTRLNEPVWLANPNAILKAFSPLEQTGAVKLIIASQCSNESAIPFLKYVLENGHADAQALALGGLLDRLPEKGLALLDKYVKSETPELIAESAKHLRKFDFPNALGILLDLLNHENPIVQTAVSQSLEEFSFSSYLSSFESLSLAARQASIRIVKRVEHDFVAELLLEMQSSGRSRRLRALEISELAKVIPQVLPGLYFLVHDTDRSIHTEAFRLLEENYSDNIRSFLETCLTAKEEHVRENAAAILEKCQVQNAANETLAPVKSVL